MGKKTARVIRIAGGMIVGFGALVSGATSLVAPNALSFPANFLVFAIGFALLVGTLALSVPKVVKTSTR